MKIPRWLWSLTALALVLFTAPLGTLAQNETSAIEIPQIQMPGIPLAGIVGNQLVVYDGMGNPTVFSLPVDAIRSYVWSDDGSMLAVIGDTTETSQLFAVSVDTGTVIALQTGVPEIFPPAFMPDGSILVASRLDNADYSEGYVSRVQQIAPQEGAAAVDKGVFTWNASCGGEYPFPSEWLVWDETGLGGAQLTFTVTPFGVLHSTSCRGSGFGLLNLQTGVDQAIPNTESIGYATAVSPDKTYVVGDQFIAADPTPISGLVRLDLASFAITPIPATHRPDHVAVDANGIIYYSAVEAAGSLFDGLTREQHDAALIGLNIPPGGNDPMYRNAASLYRLDPSTGTESTLIDRINAYAITRITPLDSQLLMYSVIPNMDALVQGFASGALSPGTLIAQPGVDYGDILPLTVAVSPTTGTDSGLPVVQGLARFSPRPISGGGGG